MDQKVVIKSQDGRPNQSSLFQVTDIRKRWSVVSIFNRIGISKKILGKEEFNRIVSDINDKAEGKNILSKLYVKLEKLRTFTEQSF